MTEEEKKHITDCFTELQNRIIKAKNLIRDMNFGKADYILSQPFPKLKLN